MNTAEWQMRPQWGPMWGADPPPFLTSLASSDTWRRRICSAESQELAVCRSMGRMHAWRAPSAFPSHSLRTPRPFYLLTVDKAATAPCVHPHDRHTNVPDGHTTPCTHVVGCVRFRLPPTECLCRRRPPESRHMLILGIGRTRYAELRIYFLNGPGVAS